MFKRIICAVLALALCFGIVGCAGNGNETTAAPTGSAELKAPASSDVIATVITGSEATEVKTTVELSAAIDESGNSQVTLWQDISHPVIIDLPYSCSIDFNGHTISTAADSGNGLNIAAAGTMNKTTTLKNGTLTQFGNGIQVQAGNVVVDNMQIHCVGGTPVCLYDAEAANSSITGSTLSSGGWTCVSYSKITTNYANTGITIDNSTLVSYAKEGSDVFSTADMASISGVIRLGEHVDIYSYGQALAAEKMLYAGSMAYKSAETKSVEVNGVTCENIGHWSTDNESDAINLLMIGNSFCFYFVQELYGISQAAGVNINVTNLYEAGCYVEEHWSWLNDPVNGRDKYEFWITNEMGRFRHGDIRTIHEALAYMDWDIITLQQHFAHGIVDYDVEFAACQPYAKNLFDHLKQNHPDSKLYWQETWAYQVGHSKMPSTAEQSARQDRIIKASNAIATENGVDLVPSGHAWKIARANSAIGDTLCLSDLYHDGDLGGGQYLNACVWFEVLTGKSCIGNTWRPNYRLSEDKIVELQKAAHEAVASVYGADYAK